MVKMELSSSKSQASSVKSIGSDLKSKIAAFQSALSSVSGIASFKGVAASKAKEYAESNMRTIAESANDLVDGVVKSVSQLPSEYTGQVDSKSHDSEKLQQSINQLQQQQSTLNSALDAANKLSDSNSSKESMIGNIKGLQSANSAKLKKQQELLQKLLQFDSNSPRYFDDIDSLFSAFEQAADNVKLDYNASSGSYGSFAVPPTVNELLKKADSSTKRWDKKHKVKFDTSEIVDYTLAFASGEANNKAKNINRYILNMHKQGEFGTRYLSHKAGKCVKCSDVLDQIGTFYDISESYKKAKLDTSKGMKIGHVMAKDMFGTFIGITLGGKGIVGAIKSDGSSKFYSHFYQKNKKFRSFANYLGDESMEFPKVQKPIGWGILGKDY